MLPKPTPLIPACISNSLIDISTWVPVGYLKGQNKALVPLFPVPNLW